MVVIVFVGSWINGDIVFLAPGHPSGGQDSETPDPMPDLCDCPPDQFDNPRERVNKVYFGIWDVFDSTIPDDNTVPGLRMAGPFGHVAYGLAQDQLFGFWPDGWQHDVNPRRLYECSCYSYAEMSKIQNDLNSVQYCVAHDITVDDEGNDYDLLRNNCVQSVSERMKELGCPNLPGPVLLPYNYEQYIIDSDHCELITSPWVYVDV